MTNDERIDTIHQYWFGQLQRAMPEAAELERRYALWFGGDSDIDLEIRRRFGDAVVLALSGAFEAWIDKDRGAMALVLLLDQFPRNMYRGRPEAYAGDARALSIVHRMLDSGRDRRLSIIERCFLYLPLEHSEALADQELCVARFEALLEEYRADSDRTEAGERMVLSSLDYARRHRAIIERFGRYPYRNAVLGRESTADEERWLNDDQAERFGQ